MNRHVLDNDAALTLLLSLEHRGVDLELDDDDLLVGPRSLLTDTEIAEIKRHKAALIRLIQICDEAVQERVESFKKQKPSTAPVLEPGYRYVAGVCFSCGDRHPDRHRWGRCWRCVLALQLTWNLTIEPGDQNKDGDDDAQSVAARKHPGAPRDRRSTPTPDTHARPTQHASHNNTERKEHRHESHHSAQ